MVNKPEPTQVRGVPPLKIRLIAESLVTSGDGERVEERGTSAYVIATTCGACGSKGDYKITTEGARCPRCGGGQLVTGNMEMTT